MKGINFWRSLRRTRTQLANGAAAILVAASGMSSATPLFLNQKAAALSGSSVVINEVSSNSAPEWVELYNKSNSPVDISGWRLKDGGGNSFGTVVSSSTQLAAHGYKVITASGVLNNSGDSVNLYSSPSPSSLVDSMNFPALTSGQTYGRSGAGQTSVGILSGSSNGFANPLFSNTAVYNQDQQFWYDNLKDAAALANSGDTLVVRDDETITSTINITKSLTVKGASGASISTSGGSSVFNITAAGTEISGLDFTKTDKPTQTLISVNANDVTIRNNSFTGQFNIDDADTSRALVVGYNTGVDIRNNSFAHLRQPAYINGATGNVLNNYVADTKGWVVVSQSNLNFHGNSWGAGSDKNAVDIAVIKDSPVGADNYLAHLMQISNANHQAVIEDQTPSSPVLTDAFVDDSATHGGNGYPISPYQTITPALSRITEGGRVHVANGTYNEALNFVKDGTQLMGESKGGVQVTAGHATSYGQGISIVGLDKVSINDMTFNAPAGSPISYHFQAYQSSNISLDNLAFNGPGKSTTPKIGGVDFNSDRNVKISNVSAENYSKNGFSFTAQYAGGDAFTRNIQLSDITSSNNNWAGIAFYTMNSSSTIGHTIPGVSFDGSNALSGNAQGIFFEGDSDSNFGASATPRYTVTGAGGSPISLQGTSFSGNSLDIVNYQKKNVDAGGALFGGKIGNQMTQTERDSENGRIIDQLDHDNFGLVMFYNLPQLLSPANDSLLNNAGTLDWSNVPGAVSYEYQSSNDSNTNPDGSLAHVIYHTTVNDSRIDASGTTDGTYYWQVRANFLDGSRGPWTAPWSLTVDQTKPDAPTLTSPDDGVTMRGTSVTQSWSDDSPDIDHYIYESYNDAAATSLRWHQTFTTTSKTALNVADSTYWWRVKAVDKAGNESDWSELRKITIDNTAPSVPLPVFPSDGTTINQNALYIEWSTATDNVNLASHITYHYQLYKGANPDTDPTHAVQLHDTAYTGVTRQPQTGFDGNTDEGTYWWRVNACDEAGNCSAWMPAQQLTVDNTAPTVAITRPLDGRRVHGTIHVSGSVDDPSAFADFIIVDHDGNQVYEATNTDGFDWNTIATSNGRYTIYFIATDGAGNQSNIDSVTVRVRNQTNTLQNAAPSGLGGGSGTNFNVQPAAQPVVLAAATASTGTATSNNTSNHGHVLGTSTTNTNGSDYSKPNGKVLGIKTDSKSTPQIFGLAWYVWLLLAIAVALLFGYLYRHAGTDDKSASNLK